MKPRSPLARRYAWLIAGLVAAAVLTQTLLQSWVAYRSALRVVEQQQQAAARLAAQGVSAYVERAQRAVAWVADFGRGAGQIDWDRLRDESHVALRREPAVESIVLADQTGRCLAVDRVRPDVRRCDVAGTDEASPLAHGGAAARVVSAAGRTPVLELILRADPDARITARSQINLAFAWDMIATIEVPGAGVAMIVDRDGRVIAHRDMSVAMAGLRLSATQLDPGVFVPPAAALVGTASGASKVIRAVHTVPTIDWRIVVESPADVVVAPILAELARSAAILLLGALAAIIGGLAIADRLARPIKRLDADMQAFGGGDRRHRSDIERSDEIGSLARSFNRMADELQQYTTHLEILVAARTHELAQANEHKSQFLANVSHELRTPLNAIIGYSEALKEDIFGELTPKQRECADDIHSSGLHLLALINDLLDLSKVEAGRIDLDLAPFAVRELVERSLGVLRERAASGGVELRADIGAEAGTWIGDELRLRQSVMNLLSNAVKFTRPGGTVTLSVRQTAGQLQIAVADTGVGIPEDQLPRLFERFSRIQNAATAGFSAPKGTGLGLALTRNFVELHGGRIAVTSRVGEGSTFTISLPAMKQAKDADRDAERDADGNGAGG